ncbi:UNVERIFIED_CONTAM: hypothetical protein H355_008749 [Colinus virginianus]|nr:hypothetical protein H355_008749 [Colinus virginianus]
MASQPDPSQPPDGGTTLFDGNDEMSCSAQGRGCPEKSGAILDPTHYVNRPPSVPVTDDSEIAADNTKSAAATSQTAGVGGFATLDTNDDDEEEAAEALMRDENAVACYRALEEDFREVLRNIPRDDALEPFRQQYEKLYGALLKSHASEWSLLKRCRRLTKQIQENAAKVVAALKISHEDQSLIDILRKEVQHAWQLVQAGKEREELSRQTIAGLRKNIEELTKAVEASESEHVAQEAKLEEHLLERERLAKECEQLTAKNAQIATSNATLSEKLKELERRAAEPQEELTHTKELLRVKKAEAQHEQRRREKLEKDLTELKRLIEQKQEELHSKQVTIEQQNKQADHLQSVVAGLHRENEEETKKLAEISARIAETETRLNEQIFKNSKIQAANFAREAELRDQEEEINKLHTEKERVIKMHEVLRKKLSQVEEEKKSLEDHRSTLKTEIMAVEREIETLKQQAEADKRSIDTLMRERDLLSKTVLKSEDAAKKQEDVLKRHEAHASQLQREIQRYRAEVDSQQAKIRELELHRDRSGQELSKANEKYISLLEEIKSGDNRVADMQRSIGELRAKLATQKTLYESVRADRNLYSRNLIESLDEISEMKQYVNG